MYMGAKNTSIHNARKFTAVLVTMFVHRVLVARWQIA